MVNQIDLLCNSDRTTDTLLQLTFIALNVVIWNMKVVKIIKSHLKFTETKPNYGFQRL